ncbi:DUF2164 domain-containing protein [Pontibacillus salicampi]|uniref:DUF2164 domain-containing protein n=1 Tax=Pontibacillus salicampi TaxID=1449801 RepID=A0ABV6LMW6_9BACI
MDMKFPREEREQIIESIQAYFEIERGEEIGNLGAEQLLDYIVQEVGPLLYNQGVRDAKKMVDQKLLNIDEDITSLEKQKQTRR